MRRHEVLRTTFKVQSGQLVQAIAPSLTIPVFLLNLRQLPTDERPTEAKRVITAEIESPVVDY